MDFYLICSRCRKYLNCNNFSKNKSSNTGYNNYCRECLKLFNVFIECKCGKYFKKNSKPKHDKSYVHNLYISLTSS